MSAEHRRRIDLATWPRTPVFEFFKAFSEPFHGVCVRVDCTEAFRFAKAHRLSVFLTLVHSTLVASMQVPNLRLRIEGGEVWEYDVIDGGSAVGRPNGTIGFAHYPFHPELEAFASAGSVEIERVKARTDLERHPFQNLIRFSTLPWLDFTSVSHARSFDVADSAPKITFGKITEHDGRRSMPVSIHVHHALADGQHVADFVAALESQLRSLGS